MSRVETHFLASFLENREEGRKERRVTSYIIIDIVCYSMWITFHKKKNRLFTATNDTV